MTGTRIAVVSNDELYIANLRNISGRLDAQVIVAGSGEDIAATTAAGIMTHRPSTVVLGSGFEFEHRVSLTEELDALHPDGVVLWVLEEDADAWRAATKAGARDLHPPDASAELMIEQLEGAIRISDRRRDVSISPSIEHDGGGRSKGRIITVVSPKGGSGKTMLTTNLAVGLQQQMSGGVVVVDLDLQFGDVTSALGLQAEYSVLDVLRSPGDATDMKAFLTGHPSGLYALPAPTNPVDAEDAEPDQIAKLLDSLSSEFDAVVVDTGAGIDEPTLVAVEQSTDVVFITTIDVAAIQALRKAVVVLDRLQLNDHKRWFVLNRATSRTGLSRREIEDVTGLAIDAEIPSHKSVSQSMNQGRPVILEQQRARIGKSLASVVKLLDPPAGRRSKVQS